MAFLHADGMTIWEGGWGGGGVGEDGGCVLRFRKGLLLSTSRLLYEITGLFFLFFLCDVNKTTLRLCFCCCCFFGTCIVWKLDETNYRHGGLVVKASAS